MTGRIPVTILSGYLGSGKTTIINRMLSGDHGLRLGVLVNDFGPINIDARLIEAEEDDLLELSNGCVCCSIGDDLGEALSALASRPNPPERLLLEASGVAEPARIAMMAGHWPGFELDAVVVTADAETVQTRAIDKFVGRLIRNQLQAADLIVLTKADLIAQGQLDKATDWLSETHPEVSILSAANGHVPAEILLGSYDRGDALDEPLDLHVQFATAVWRPDGPVDYGRLTAILDALPSSIHRVKGFVKDSASGKGMLVQAVGARSRITPTEHAEDPCLVMIGTGSHSELELLCRQLDQLG